MTQLDLSATEKVQRGTPSVAAQLRAAWRTYFGTPLNAVISVACLVLIYAVLKVAITWMFVDALWVGSSEDCKLNDGACWPFIEAKLRFFIFGFYPYEQHWRPGVALIIMLTMTAVSMIPMFWSQRLLMAWAVALMAMFVLMAGGIFGLEAISTTQWGGFPLTIMLSFVGLGVAFPLGVVLALARRSKMPAIRVLAVSYIELMRGVPLISVLFMASVMLPLFLPDGMTIDKVLRAQVAIILFAAAYVAEVVRGGLQGVDRGQYEAGQALGLSYWQSMRKIILPQALKIVIPPMVTLFIGFFQDTTLVTIIGLFDFLNTVRAALRDPEWQGIAVMEAYLFTAFVYLVFSYTMGAYSRYLERRFKTGHD